MKLGINWFDVLVIVLLIVGVFRGRKRGMSMELLPLLQVLIIVVVGAELYEPLGKQLAASAGSAVNIVLSYIIVYVLFAIAVHLIFSRIKSAVGEKLVGSDVFGRMEYYFGMTAGMLRYAAIVIMGMALMNAQRIDHAAEARNRKMQAENFGTISFPTFGSIQIDIFEKSRVGVFARDHLSQLLIEPTTPNTKGRSQNENIGKRKQRALEEAMGTATPPPAKKQ